MTSITVVSKVQPLVDDLLLKYKTYVRYKQSGSGLVTQRPFKMTQSEGGGGKRKGENKAVGKHRKTFEVS